MLTEEQVKDMSDAFSMIHDACATVDAILMADEYLDDWKDWQPGQGRLLAAMSQLRERFNIPFRDGSFR